MNAEAAALVAVGVGRYAVMAAGVGAFLCRAGLLFNTGEQAP